MCYMLLIRHRSAMRRSWNDDLNEKSEYLVFETSRQRERMLYRKNNGKGFRTISLMISKLKISKSKNLELSFPDVIVG